MTRSKHMPLSSFGAELQEVMRQGANKEIRITFDTEALATRFLHRINTLRVAMKREKHPDWEQLYRCSARKDEQDPKILIVAPRDSEFLPALKSAGIAVVEPEISEYKVPTPAPDSGGVEDFLGELRDVTTVPKKTPGLDKL
jgi:hypothetical protein